MGQEGVGVFRNDDEAEVSCPLFPPNYATSAQARAEFHALDLQIKSAFGDSYGLGKMIYEPSTGGTVLHYNWSMNRGQVRQIYNKFLSEFYGDIDRSRTSDEKLWAIAKLHQRLEWLHPVRDGTSRTSIALMNKNLTDCGFHPAILEFPHVSSSLSLGEWKAYLQAGLLKWEWYQARWEKYQAVFHPGMS